MAANTEKELEQKYLDNVIDKVREAEQKAEEKSNAARHDITGLTNRSEDRR